MAEGDHGEDAGGAPCGDVAGEEGDDAEQNDDGSEGEPVRDADAVEQAAQEAGEEERGGESDEDAGGGEAQALRENLAEDDGFLRTEGDADTDFVGALFGCVGDDSIEADGGEEEREEAEGAGEVDNDALEDVAHLHIVFEGGDVVEGQVGVEAGGGLLDCGGVRERITGDTEVDGDFAAVALPEGQEDGGGWIVNQATVFGVSGDADDGARCFPELHLFADGVLSGPVAISESLIDDDDGLGAGAVRVGEVAAAEDWRAQGGEVVGADVAAVGFDGFMRLRDVAFGLDAVGVDGEAEGEKSARVAAWTPGRVWRRARSWRWNAMPLVSE